MVTSFWISFVAWILNIYAAMALNNNPEVRGMETKTPKHFPTFYTKMSKIWTKTKTFKDLCCNCYHENLTCVNLRCITGDEGHCLGQGPNLLGWKVWWCRHVGRCAAPDVLKEWIHTGCPDWMLKILLWTYYDIVIYKVYMCMCVYTCRTMYTCHILYIRRMFILYNQIVYTCICIRMYIYIYDNDDNDDNNDTNNDSKSVV